MKRTELWTVLVAENREKQSQRKMTGFGRSSVLVAFHVFWKPNGTELLTVLVAGNREIQAQRKNTGCGRSSVLVAFHVFWNKNGTKLFTVLVVENRQNRGQPQNKHRAFNGFGCREPRVMFFDKISYLFDNRAFGGFGCREPRNTISTKNHRLRQIIGFGCVSCFLKPKWNRTFCGFGCGEPKKKVGQMPPGRHFGAPEISP